MILSYATAWGVHAQSFGVNTVYYDRHEKPHLNEIGAEYFSDLDTFLGRCDIVAINVRHQQPYTRVMLNAASMRLA